MQTSSMFLRCQHILRDLTLHWERFFGLKDKQRGRGPAERRSHGCPNSIAHILPDEQRVSWCRGARAAEKRATTPLTSAPFATSPQTRYLDVKRRNRVAQSILDPSACHFLRNFVCPSLSQYFYIAKNILRLFFTSRRVDTGDSCRLRNDMKKFDSF